MCHHANPKLWHRPSRRSGAVAQAISQIGRDGRGHLANPSLWHGPSRKSDAMAQAISQIGRDGRKGASHLRNPTPWHKPSRKSGEMVPWRRICVISGPVCATASDLRDGGARFCHTVGFARWRGAILPCRRICEMARARSPHISPNTSCADTEASLNRSAQPAQSAPPPRQ